MATPRIIVEVDVTNEPTSESRTWIELRKWRRITIRRGRQAILDRIEPSTCSIWFDNRDGYLSPDNTVSPYYPGFDVGTPIRVRAEHITGDAGLFSGYIENPNRTTPEKYDALIQVACVDGFAALRGDELQSDYMAERVDERISNILDEIDWPVALRSIETSLSSMPAKTMHNSSPQAEIDLACDTELGIFFFDGNGVATFHNRDHRSTYGDPAYTFSGNGGLPYQDCQISRPGSGIYNRVAVQSAGLAEQVANDNTSRAKRFRRTHARQTAHTTTAEALNQAQFILHTHKDPISRPSLSLIGGAGNPENDLYEAMIQLELGDRIRVVKREPGSAGRGDGSADTFDKSVWVENITHNISDQGLLWIMQIETSPAEYWAAWLLGIDGATELGETTILGY